MFESLKEKLQQKIEKDAVKSILNGEVVYMKKSRLPLIGDWARIYPPVNEDGTWNIPNLLFGGWKNLFRLFFILALAGMILFAFYEVFQSFEAFRSQPCVQLCIEAANNIIN